MDILPQLLVNALISGSIYAIASSGLSLAYGLQRILNFAQGHFMMVGAYAFFFARVLHEGSLAEAGLVSLLVMLVLGLSSLYIFVLPFSAYSPLLPFVTTLALGAMLESCVSMFFGVNVQSISRGLEFESLEFGGVYITPIQILIILSAVVLLGALALVVHGTSFGRKVRALSEHRYAAASLGTSYTSTTILVFCLGAVLSGYAGILVGLETNIQPTMGGSYTIKAFAAMTLGGLGNLWGTVLGSFLLGLIENLSIGLDFGGYSLPAGYKDAFAFVIILMVLLIKPEGLFRRVGRRV
jgi:branched-chain amino acid transport system permease protein